MTPAERDRLFELHVVAIIAASQAVNNRNSGPALAADMAFTDALYAIDVTQ